MEIREITTNKENFIDILLIGDEDINMINKYLELGTIFALYEKDLKAICVVIKLDNVIEIKNLATYPKYQNKGYASKLIEFVCNKYRNNYEEIILGTGENENILKFYNKRGFKQFKKINNFFVMNYSRPIYENGKQLIDMIYLKKNLKNYNKNH